MSDQDAAKAALVDTNGPVSLSISNTTIIVAAGNVTSSPTDGAQRGGFNEGHAANRQSSREEKYLELCNVVNDNTLKTTSVTVTEDVDCDLINEPNFQVFPQMRWIKDYFTRITEGVKRKSQTSKKIFPGKNKTKSKTKKDEDLPDEEEKNNELITVDDLVKLVTSNNESLSDATYPITAVLSSAGAGKTTLLKRMARQIVETRPDQTADETVDKESRLKMIHYLEINDIKHNNQLKPSQLLFGGLYKNEAEEDEAYQWLIDHQSNAILFLDGLTTPTWIATSSNPIKIRPFEKSSWTVILYNILSRSLLPHLTVLVSSRHMEGFALPVELRPHDVIHLEGLSLEDAEKLFVSVVGHRGVEIWESLKTTSPQILNLASSPLFLLLLVMQITQEPLPVTVTEFYSKVLASVSPGESVKEREQILEVIQKMKMLAYQGMVEERCSFYESDLMKYGLSIEPTRDLMMNSSGNKLLCRHWFGGDAVDFFKTQQVLEYLSACHIIQKERKKFEQLNKKLLCESRWSAVWKFVSGIIHDKSISELHEVSHSKKKKKTFDETVQSRFEKGWNGVEFLATIYESNDGELIKSFPYLPSLALSKLTADEAHMFGSIMARRRSLEKVEMVDLWRCGIDDSLVEVIVKNLKGFKVQVGILNLRENFITANGLNSILAYLDTDHIWIDYTRLGEFRYADLDWINIRKIDLESFKMTNEEGAVRFEGGFYGGFDKQEMKLSLFYKSSTETMADPTALIAFFGPEVKRLVIGVEEEGEQRKVAEIENPKPQRKRADSQISWSIFKHVTSLSGESGQIRSDDQVYMNLQNFMEVSKRNTKIEMKMVLLDCRSEENIDTTSIELCVRKFKVTFLDVLMDEKTSFASNIVSTEFESRVGVKVKFHWWFKVTGVDDVTNLIPKVQKHQVENLRLHFVKGISMVVASSVIASCKLQKLTIVHQCTDKTYKKDLHKISKMADRNSIELELVLCQRGNNAWQVADSVSTKKALPTIQQNDKPSEE